MTVARLLERKGGAIVSVEPDHTVANAAGILREKRIGALLVCQDGEMRGIISERDIVAAIAAGKRGIADTPVSEIMTAKVERCTAKDTIVSIHRRMEEGRFRHMPVFRDDELIGLVSITDIARERVAEAEREAQDVMSYVDSRARHG